MVSSLKSLRMLSVQIQREEDPDGRRLAWGKAVFNLADEFIKGERSFHVFLYRKEFVFSQCGF